MCLCLPDSLLLCFLACWWSVRRVCVLSCRFCFARLRWLPSFPFPCDGAVPRTGKVFQVSLLPDTAGIVMVAYMDSLPAHFGMLWLGEDASEHAHLFATPSSNPWIESTFPQERESRSRTMTVMSTDMSHRDHNLFENLFKAASRKRVVYCTMREFCEDDLQTKGKNRQLLRDLIKCNRVESSRCRPLTLNKVDVFFCQVVPLESEEVASLFLNIWVHRAEAMHATTLSG